MTLATAITQGFGVALGMMAGIALAIIIGCLLIWAIQEWEERE